MLFGVGDLMEVPMPWGEIEREMCLPACLPAACCLRPPACLPFALPSLRFPCVTNITLAMSHTCYLRRPGSFSDFSLATLYILDPYSSVISAAFLFSDPAPETIGLPRVAISFHPPRVVISDAAQIFQRSFAS